MTTDFLYEAANANATVRAAVEKHAKMNNLPVKYGFGGLSYYCDEKNYGVIPYIHVRSEGVKIGRFRWHKDSDLAKLLTMQPRTHKIQAE